MASSRVKTTFTVHQTESKIHVDFNEKTDYVLVDFRSDNVFISLGFQDKPFDEMITLKLSGEIDADQSSYTHNKTEDKLLHLIMVKKNNDVEIKIDSTHKFIEKKNHPLADPRGYQVKKPEKKNWDKIVATLDDSDEGEGDANQALKKIYDQCDDDTRRAMEKSLYESNGTVLNMNWGEVGAKKIGKLTILFFF